MIRLANYDDLDEIMHIVALIIQEMNSYGSTQWDETYPKRCNFEEDVKLNRLYIDVNNENKIRGVAAFVTEDDPEYLVEGIKWLKNTKPLILHRFVVSPEYRYQHVGQNIVNFAIDEAKKRNIDHLKCDTNSMNKGMQNFLLKMNFQRIEGIIHFRPEKDFYGYEMLL